MMLFACGIAGAERRQAKAETPPATDAKVVEVETQASENASEQNQAQSQTERWTSEDKEENHHGERSPVVKARANSSADLTEHVFKKIAELSPASVDQEELNEAGIRGMLQSLDDPYSALFSEEKTKEFFEVIDGKMVGIGVELSVEENSIVITSVLPNSPARDAGLLARDIIVKVEDKPTGNLVETVEQIRGKAGTEVNLTVRRAGKTLKLTLTRDEVRLPTVKGTSLKRHSPDDQADWQHWLDADQRIAFVQIVNFDKLTPKDLREPLTRLSKQSLKGLILDLRGNYGGLMMSSVEVARMFLKEGTIVEVRGRAPTENAKQDANVGQSPILADTPLIVLIDASTASAAEVLASALKENDRAILIGERTFGKGSVQALLPIAGDGRSLRLTTALMYSASGQPLQREADSKRWGVEPSDGFFVPLTAEQKATRQRLVLARETGTLHLQAKLPPAILRTEAGDPQLAAALKSMTAKLETGEFAKTGQPIADQVAWKTKRAELKEQREALRKQLAELNRQLDELR